MDPFPITADPASYQPREATESALQRLEDGFRRGRRVQVLSGPPGLGKTLLLHVLAARLDRDFKTLYLPYVSLAWQDLCAWILGLLGEPAGAFPDRELLGSARRFALRGRPLLLLVDEASGIPAESAEALGQLVDEAGGALRVLLVPLDDTRAGRVLAVLARDVEELRLSAPLTLEESERYLRTRLVRSNVDFALQRRFDADTVAHLHRVSGGNPRRLNYLASEVLRGNLAVLPGSEARAELGATPTDSDSLEVDAPDAACADDADAEATEPALRPAPPPRAPAPVAATRAAAPSPEPPVRAAPAPEPPRPPGARAHQLVVRRRGQPCHRHRPPRGPLVRRPDPTPRPALKGTGFN